MISFSLLLLSSLAARPVVPLPPSLEPYLSAPGLYDLTRGYRPGQAAAQVGDGGFPKLRYWDPNRVRIAVPAKGSKATETAALFTFERRAPFTWKLVQIRLPEPAE